MNAETVVLIAESDAPRADAYLASATDYTRSQLQKWLKDGALSVNGKQGKPNTAIRAGDTLRLAVPEAPETVAVPQDIPLDIVYEDEDLCVIHKPKGMVVHPAPGNPDGTLVNALLFHFAELSGVGGAQRPGIVHRIDRDTSGLLVVAKNDTAHERLAAQFADHSAHRSYVCLVHGNWKEDSGTIDAPIGRHPVDRKRMAVVPNGRRAVTHWRVLQRYGEATFLAVELETGRTHQIRVHMAYSKHPILGDPVYGSTAPKLGLYSQALHGCRLTFTHPRTGETMVFTAPLPSDFETALRRLSDGGTLPDWR
ncbi:MAG: RluA family pseudouridine synthase [Clostridia bacterium]|nr:RluA family pseudouridine synthase [Clostridia bacterium]